MKRSGTSEADFRTAANKKAGRQYRAVRWFLLSEAELRPRQQAADYKSAETMNCKSVATYYQPQHYNSRRSSAAGWPYHPRAGSSSPARDAYGRRRQNTLSAAGWQPDCKSAATYDRLNPELQPKLQPKLQRKHKEAAPGNRCSLLNCVAQD